MDYDHVVTMNATQKLGCAKLKSVDPDADFAIAKVAPKLAGLIQLQVLCYEPEFETSPDQIKEACDRFWKAWCRGIQV